ncbi:hypothetical protein AGLY_013504, partial [Aphis glycines]
ELRVDECIDFTMMCLLFEKEIESSWYFRGSKTNPKKIREKRDFLRKTSLRQNRIFYFVITQKLIDHSPYTIKFKFSKNFEQLKFSIFLIVLKMIKKNPKSLVTIFFYGCLKFKFIRNMSKLRKFAILKIWYKILHKFFFKYLVDKIFLALSKYLKILYKVPHMSLKHKPPFSPTTGNYILG